MSDHTMTFDFDNGWVQCRAKCNAPETAVCRAIWDCECESWVRDGVDDRGPWHEVYDGWDIEAVRHYGRPGAPPEDCAKVLSINDYPDELGRGEITLPIDITYDGDGYVWRVVS